jgi:hypothetical protein
MPETTIPVVVLTGILVAGAAAAAPLLAVFAHPDDEPSSARFWRGVPARERRPTSPLRRTESEVPSTDIRAGEELGKSAARRSVLSAAAN